MKNLAVIPARSGSKGLKDKNIKELMGHPLIWYTINAALESQMFDEIMVSTDSDTYARIAKECGAAVPFLRSEEQSSDHASSWSVVKEVLENYDKMGRRFDTVMLLQPTSPLREAQDIVNAYQILLEKDANSVVGVCEMDHSPLWSNTLPEDKCLNGFIRDEVKNQVRQALQPYYRINGAIYLTRIDYSRLRFDLYTQRGYAYQMDKKRSIDIDDELDFQIAQTIISIVTACEK